MFFTRRNLLRLVILLVCAVFALGVLPERWLRANLVLPALSPLLNLGGAIAARTFGILMLAALPLVVLPFFKGRFFCWRLCPMGFVAETVSRLNKRNARLLRRIPFIGKWLAPVILGSAAAGYPLLIWTDPLCIFNGFFAAWRAPATAATAVTATGFILILAASLLVPNCWCHRLCPLGGLEELLTQFANRLRARRKAAAAEPAPAATGDIHLGRRTFFGLIGSAAAARAAAAVTGRQPQTVIRPPGAAPAFNALCSRCGNCMKACEFDLIVPDLGESGVDGLFTPSLKFRSRNDDQQNFCFQDCVACTQVCPTRALRPLTVAEKQQVAIGKAIVDKKKCIAWENKEYCVVCQEYCPYQAVIEVERNGVMCPEIDEDKCRGCGACESQCPALPIAITIAARAPQTVLAAPSPYLEG